MYNPILSKQDLFLVIFQRSPLYFFTEVFIESCKDEYYILNFPQESEIEKKKNERFLTCEK